MSEHNYTHESLASSEPATSTADTDGDSRQSTVLELDNIARSYATETAVEDLSFSVGDGEVLTLLGPSGCGKTTTLRLIGGLERPNDGTIKLGDRVLADVDGTFVPPEERGIGLVFQDFALFPHLTAAENVGFGLTEWPERASGPRRAIARPRRPVGPRRRSPERALGRTEIAHRARALAGT